MTPAALSLDGVSRHFGETLAVDDVSLDVRAGEILALVGPSGCGKSTLLRMAAGLLGTDAGTIHIAGELVDDGRTARPPERRHIGLVFQEHALFPHLTVERNLAFGLRGRPRDDQRTRVGEVLGLVGLSDLSARYPHELSGGERQRVALARALAPDPTLLLLDEPFASLDPNLKASIRRDVVEILRETGTPAVFVTHDQTEALAVGDRIAVMRSGRVRQVDTPWDVFHRPVDTFVAAFMGEASFLPLDSSGPTATCELGEVEVGHLDTATTATTATAATAMVRPDDLAVVADSDGDARIVASEFRGSEWSYTVELASGARVIARTSHLRELEVGDRTHVTLAPGHRPVAVPT